MKNLIHIVFGCALFSLSGQALALGISPWTKVTVIIQGPGGFPEVQIADPGDAGSGCPQSGYVRLNDVENSVSGKRLFSTLLTALASGKGVRIETSACSSDYPYIEYVYIRS